MKYKTYSIGGGGTEQDEGIWEIKETPKTITLKCIEESFFGPDFKSVKINKYYRDGKSASRKLEEDGVSYIGHMNNGHVLRDWLDGTYTLYPNQGGKPYIFEPIS